MSLGCPSHHTVPCLTNWQVAKSDDSRVVLERVDLDAEGRYGCEVTTEYPFDTVTATGNITVVGEYRFSLGIACLSSDLKVT